MSKVLSNERVTPRLFKNNLLEAFSKVSWYVPMLLYLPVVTVSLYFSFSSIKFGLVFLIFVAGIFAWTFVEYLLHRFVFHYEPKSELGQRIHFIFHGVHHSYPRDPLRLVMPPSVSIPLAFFFFYLFKSIFPDPTHLPFFAGFVLGYVIYDTIHYAVHHFPIRNKLLLKIKTHHMKHHYKSENSRFGVSSPLWDIIFGTNR
jgi:sterol desaturase/sphingolipid hydroxylase (fatty acid hydroxylase superfamily)